MLALGAGAVAAGLLAALVARPIFKLKGHYLAMATLGLGIIINIALRNEATWTGGPDGMPVPAMGLFGFELSNEKHWYWVVALVLSVSVWASLNLIDSPFGRVLRALHGSEVASQVVGVVVSGVTVVLVQEVFSVVKMLKAQGMTIILAEQNAFAALAIADRGHVMETGTITLSGTGQELISNEQVRAAYLGM